MYPTNASDGDNSGMHRICAPLSVSCFYTASSEEEKEAQESTAADKATPTV